MPFFICRFPYLAVVLRICSFLGMVGLGNSCRGMKSPPLLMAALVACIIVLGFNYWIASSRSMVLQVRFFCSVCHFVLVQVINIVNEKDGSPSYGKSRTSACCRSFHKFYSCCLSVVGDWWNERNAYLYMRGAQNLAMPVCVILVTSALTEHSAVLCCFRLNM